MGRSDEIDEAFLPGRDPGAFPSGRADGRGRVDLAALPRPRRSFQASGGAVQWQEHRVLIVGLARFPCVACSVTAQ